MADAPLTVTVTHMRESNGNEWWSAHLYRATGKTMAFTEGYEFYQSPIKGRVDYEADCMRKLLDPSLPDVDILAYDTDAPATPSPPVAAPPATPAELSLLSATWLIGQMLELLESWEPLAPNPKLEAIEWAAQQWIADPTTQPQPQPAQPLTGAPGDEDLALNMLAMMFDRWENGTPCYEEPESQAGYLGSAFKVDNDEFHAIADLLNRRRPVLNMAGITAPSTPTQGAQQ